MIVSLFLALYLLSITVDHLTAASFAIMIAVAVPLWDENLISLNDRVENTLWVALSVFVGAAVTVVVEFVFHQVHPTTQLTQAIDSRLKEVEEVLRHVGEDLPLDGDLEKQISLYSSLGTSRLRRLLARSGYGTQFIAQMNAAISLLGHLVELAASLRVLRVMQPGTLTESDRQRCVQLADLVAELRRSVQLRQLPRPIRLPEDQPSNLPFLPAMEHTTALIPQSFSGSAAMDEYLSIPMEEEASQRLFVPDAFVNRTHLEFAVRGLIAAMLSYVLYNAIAWRGLSTSIATCAITALSTIGASRQKQFLRLCGALIGGFMFGMGAQVLILPHLDSIVGFAVLFAGVTAVGAWICTSTPRLSYLGIQLALAFYLVNLQEFTIQTSLAVARDRVFGVLLGLMCMWLAYDLLWAKDAQGEMQAQFARNLEMMAELADQLAKDSQWSVKRIRQLRDRINAGFQAVSAQSDAVIFEFGPSRPAKMERRDDIRRWQPSLRTLLQVQLTSLQYRPPKVDQPASGCPHRGTYRLSEGHSLRDARAGRGSYWERSD